MARTVFVRSRHPSVEVAASASTAEVMRGDRRFFARHPERSFRVRPAAPAELQAAIAENGPFEALAIGWVWFVAVRKLTPNVRARIFFAAPGERAHDQEAPEGLARLLYEREVAQRPGQRALHDRLGDAARAAEAGDNLGSVH